MDPAHPITAFSSPAPSPAAGALGGPLVESVLAVAAGIVVIAVDAQLVVRFASGHTILGRHGYRPAQMVGRPLPELIPAGYRERLLPVYRRALAGEYTDCDVLSDDGDALYHVQAGPLREGEAIIGAVTVSRDVTYERQVERGFETALASAADGIVGVGRDGRIVAVNGALCALSGYTELELLDAPVELLVPDARRHVHADLRAGYARAPRQRAMAAGLPLALRRKDGVEVPVEIGLAPSADDGTVTVATVRDLRARRRAEEQLRQARERFELAFEAAPIGMALVGLDGRWLQVNQALCQITGRTEAELLATEYLAITHPQDRAAEEALVADLLAGRRERYELDKRYLLPDGTPVPVSLHVSLARDGDGAPAHFIGQVVDISGRQRAERALSDERDFLAALLQSLDAGVIACDADNRLTLFNAFAERVHGAEALAADRWPGEYRLAHPDGRPMAPEELPLSRALAGEHVRDAEVLVAGDGRAPTVLSVNAQTITTADGRRLGAVAVQHDITESRRLQDALRLAEARWRGAFRNGPVGMALVDLATRGAAPVRAANEALGRMLGYADVGALEGCELTALAWQEADVVLILELLERVADEPGERQEVELRLRRPDGLPVWAQLTVAATVDPVAGTLAVAHLKDVSERRGYQERLEHLADHDPLTGHFNRRRFDEELERTVAVARRHGHPAALLMIDLDQFKYVNDTYGHLVGDEVIRHVGQALRTRLRDTDVLGRIGGDEFAVILGETDPVHAEQVAGQLLDELRAAAPTMSTGQALALTASIGVVPITGTTPMTPGELLMEADIAMYDAKDAGRNQVAVATGGRQKHARMKHRLTWAERIRQALEEDRLELYAQPIFRAADAVVDRHELLLRLREEDGGLVEPGRFLYIAERFGQIQQIDRWVMRQAIAAMAGQPDRRLAINLSGASIVDADTIALLADLLATHRVDPGHLTVEITETSAIRSIEVARGFAQQLADLGCLLALDDFGSGFGSFFYLKHLPFTCLKIDGEFIRGMTTSRSDRLTVEAIVQIAKGLGKRTTAEYVADQRSLDLVRALGIDFAQGFLLGRPAPFEDRARA